MSRIIVLSLVFFVQFIFPQSIPILNLEELESRFEGETNEVYIVNFWATWCKPCVEEMPVFEEISSKYDEAQVKVILVSLDWTRNIDSLVIPFIKKHELTSEVVVLDEPNPNKWINQISRKWSGAIPGTLIVSKKHGFREFYEGMVSFEQVDKIIKDLITQK